MSFKTDRLIACFPDIYGARDTTTLLHKTLDAFGAAFLQSDNAIKELLKSHWVDHAKGPGLDALGELLNVSRRRLPNGLPETDETFRPLLKATVPSFIGGGTAEAIRGAVRAALGLPYNLDHFLKEQTAASGSPDPALQDLINDLKDLVQVEDFSPRTESLQGHGSPTTEGLSAIELHPDFPTVLPLPPQITLKTVDRPLHAFSLFLNQVEVIKSAPAFSIPQGSSLVLATTADQAFCASLNGQDVTPHFTAPNGDALRTMPLVPSGPSAWRFQAQTEAGFDVHMRWLRHCPLMFDVIVPYHIEAALQRLLGETPYAARIKAFQGHSLESLQKVIEHNQAAGVRGMVQFALRLPGESVNGTLWEDHGAEETRLVALLDFRGTEAHDQQILTFQLSADGSLQDAHEATESFILGGVFDVATFDRSFGFQ